MKASNELTASNRLSFSIFASSAVITEGPQAMSWMHRWGRMNYWGSLGTSVFLLFVAFSNRSLVLAVFVIAYMIYAIRWLINN